MKKLINFKNLGLLIFLFLTGCFSKDYVVKIGKKGYTERDLKFFNFSNKDELLKKLIVHSQSLKYESDNEFKEYYKQKEEEFYITDIIENSSITQDIDNIIKYEVNNEPLILNRYHLMYYKEKPSGEGELIYDSGGLIYYEELPENIKSIIKKGENESGYKLDIYERKVATISEYKNYYIEKMQKKFIDKQIEKYLKDAEWNKENIKKMFNNEVYALGEKINLPILKINKKEYKSDYFYNSKYWKALNYSPDYDSFSDFIQEIYLFENIKEFNKEVQKEQNLKNKKKILFNEELIEFALYKYLFNNKEYESTIKEYYNINGENYSKLAEVRITALIDTSKFENIQDLVRSDKKALQKGNYSLFLKSSNGKIIKKISKDTYLIQYLLPYEEIKKEIILIFLKDFYNDILTEYSEELKAGKLKIKVWDEKLNKIFENI